MEEKMDTLDGVISRINYYNPENGYTVAILELDYKNKNIAIKKSKIIGNTIAIVGFFERKPSEQEEYTFEGDFVRDKNYGLQFKFTKFIRKTVKNEQGIISYLSSSLFPGIGPKIAKIIIETLGVNCLSKIKEDISSAILTACTVNADGMRMELCRTGDSRDCRRWRLH